MADEEAAWGARKLNPHDPIHQFSDGASYRSAVDASDGASDDSVKWWKQRHANAAGSNPNARGAHHAHFTWPGEGRGGRRADAPPPSGPESPHASTFHGRGTGGEGVLPPGAHLDWLHRHRYSLNGGGGGDGNFEATGGDGSQGNGGGGGSGR